MYVSALFFTYLGGRRAVQRYLRMCNNLVSSPIVTATHDVCSIKYSFKMGCVFVSQSRNFDRICPREHVKIAPRTPVIRGQPSENKKAKKKNNNTDGSQMCVPHTLRQDRPRRVQVYKRATSGPPNARLVDTLSSTYLYTSQWLLLHTPTWRS